MIETNQRREQLKDPEWASAMLGKTLLGRLGRPEEVANVALFLASDAFRSLIDLAIKHSGSYYLTYHRFASREQVEACYPQFPQFLAAKREHDPAETFQSNWYRHYRNMFG